MTPTIGYEAATLRSDQREWWRDTQARKENTMRPYVRVSGLLFGLVALGHLIRAVRRWPLLIAGYPIPAAVSLLVCLLAGAMALWAWRVLSRPEVAG